jgi:MFS family permease
MPYETSTFYDYIPRWVGDVSIFILLLSQTFVSGISPYSSGYMVSIIGDEYDNVRLAAYASSIGLMTMLPLYYRLRQLFRRKHLWLYGLFIELLLCLQMTQLHGGIATIVLSFMMGMVRCVCLIDGIGVLMRRFNSGNSRGLFYGLYYPVSYTGGQLYGFLSAIIILNYGWRYTYYASVFAIVLSILIVFFCMHPLRQMRKVPLYQFDWRGLFCFTTFAFALTYICVNGERLDWFHSLKINVAAIASIIFFCLFIWRISVAKRPFLNLKILKMYPQVAIGISFMFVMYFLYNTTSLLSSFMEHVLGFDARLDALTNLYMIPAFLIAIPFTGYLLHKGFSVRLILFISFSLFALYYFSASKLFSSGGEVKYFLLPQLLKGAAYGATITTLSYYASANVDRAFNGDRAFFSMATRYVIAAPVTISFYENILRHREALHYANLAQNFQTGNYRTMNYLNQLQHIFINKNYDTAHAKAAATALATANVHKHSVYLATQDIYQWLMIAACALAVIVVAIKKLDIHYQKEKNRYALLDA